MQQLTYLKNNDIKELKGRIARWTIKIQPFDFTIKHRAWKIEYQCRCTITIIKMDENLYQQLFQYLKGNRINENLSDKERQQLINKAKYYQIINEQLYKKPRKWNPGILKVIQRSEFEPLMEMMHDHSTAGHLGIESTYNKIKEKILLESNV